MASGASKRGGITTRTIQMKDVSCGENKLSVGLPDMTMTSEPDVQHAWQMRQAITARAVCGQPSQGTTDLSPTRASSWACGVLSLFMTPELTTDARTPGT